MDTLNPASPQQAIDEARIRHLVQQMAKHWNAGDGYAYAALFTEDADFVTINGLHIHGRQAIADGHQQIFTASTADANES